MDPEKGPVVGVLLAGGMSRRMGGGDKCLRLLEGRPILSHIVERAESQVSRLIINANGDASRFSAYGLEVVPDVIDGFAGPLAGILTAMEWTAQNVPEAPWIASFATDAPFLPMDLVTRLHGGVAAGNADIAVAASGGRAHPVFALWAVKLRDDLRRAMEDEEIRKIDLWTARHRTQSVEFACAPVDPFFNVNQPDDLAEAEGLLAKAKTNAAGK